MFNKIIDSLNVFVEAKKDFMADMHEARAAATNEDQRMFTDIMITAAELDIEYVTRVRDEFTQIDITEEMMNAGYDAMRAPDGSPAKWIVLGTAAKVFEAMVAADKSAK